MGKEYCKKWRSEQVSLNKEPRLVWICMKDEVRSNNEGRQFFEVDGPGNAGNYPPGTIVTINVEEGGV